MVGRKGVKLLWRKRVDLPFRYLVGVLLDETSLRWWVGVGVVPVLKKLDCVLVNRVAR